MILGVDPGGTTGLVLLDPVDPTVLSYSQLDLKSGDTWAGALTIAVALADVIAAERFTISQRTIQHTRQHDALDVLGALRYLSVIEHKQLRLQMASDAKAAFSNDVLKKLGLFDSVTGEHARDALRHALLAARALYRTV
jgi:hypothetical protein